MHFQEHEEEEYNIQELLGKTNPPLMSSLNFFLHRANVHEEQMLVFLNIHF